MFNTSAKLLSDKVGLLSCEFGQRLEDGFAMLDHNDQADPDLDGFTLLDRDDD